MSLILKDRFSEVFMEVYFGEESIYLKIGDSEVLELNKSELLNFLAGTAVWLAEEA